MSERRSGTRLRTILSGQIRLDEPASIYECAVRDISDTGAQIALKHLVKVPHEFDLEIPKRNMSVRAKLVWSHGLRHGLSFTDIPPTVEEIARALYEAEGDGYSWDREPEILKQEFRRLARRHCNP